MLQNEASELQTDMGSNLAMDRIYVTPDNSLIIRNITDNDTGIYYCRDTYGQQNNSDYSYLLDLILNTTILPKIGNLTMWKMYQATQLESFNTKLHNSPEHDFASLRDLFHIQLEVHTHWESWGPCVACNIPQGERRRVGKCKLKVHTLMNKNKTVKENATAKLEVFNGMTKFSCRSRMFAQRFPNISLVGSNIPDFVQIENCSGICIPGSDVKVLPGRKKEKGKNYTLQFYQLTEGSSLTLVCPNAKIESVVTWQKNGVIMIPKNATEEKKHLRITVDVFGTLHLIAVTRSEKGNYTCFVNNLKMHEVTVDVLSALHLIGEESARHMVYLGFVFLICFMCYCGGIFVVSLQRNRFKVYNM